MKKIILPLIFYPFSMLFGQETNLVTKDKDKYYEEYTVLKTDKKIKHGNYLKLNKRPLGNYAIECSGQYNHGLKDGYWETYYGISNNIKSRGFYKNNLQDSIWTFYLPDYTYRDLVEAQNDQGTFLQVEGANPIPGKTGKYRNGKAIGKWEYFDNNGQLTHIYDHDISGITYLKNKQEDIENHEAGFIDGQVFLYQHLYDTIDFDRLMSQITNLTYMESGKLVFKFSIDTLGSVKDIVCTEQTITNKKFYSKALESINSFDGLWYPKIANGNKVSSERYIIFELKKDYKSNYTMSEKFTTEHRSWNYNLVISMETNINN